MAFFGSHQRCHQLHYSAQRITMICGHQELVVYIMPRSLKHLTFVT
ncbi:hypothetical protein V6Z11_A03G188000 [Gossypium hirsutum]